MTAASPRLPHEREAHKTQGFLIFDKAKHVERWVRKATALISVSHCSRMIAKTLLAGCSKTLRYKAPEIPRSETYIAVRRNDEG